MNTYKVSMTIEVPESINNVAGNSGDARLFICSVMVEADDAGAASQQAIRTLRNMIGVLVVQVQLQQSFEDEGFGSIGRKEPDFSYPSEEVKP